MSPPVYRDPGAPLAARVDALLALMSDEQKLDCLAGVPPMTLADGYALPGITDAGVEGLHGAGHNPAVTMFPQAIGLGSTWDAELVEAVGRVVGLETRLRDPRALRVYAPVQDVRSNPLAGRYEEGYGEDPFLCGRLGTAYAFGIRGRHPVYLLAKPEMKHFFGYNHEWQRTDSSSSMSCRAMHEYHLVPHRMPVAAGAVLGAMTAYNLVNGVPAIIHPALAELRAEAPEGFMFVPDMWDMVNLLRGKGVPCDLWEQGEESYATGLGPDPAAVTGALLLRAGMTNLFDANDELDPELVAGARRAVRSGLLGASMADVDRLVRDWLTYLLRTGVLDGEANPYATPAPPDGPALALRAAREQLVLLKNDHRLLPLDAAGRLALIGPLADANLRDYYSPLVPDHARVTPRQGIVARLGEAKLDYLPAADTVAWRSVADGAWVTALPDGELVATPEPADGRAFQVYDWGYDLCFFRSVATGGFLRADEPIVERATRVLADEARMVDANEWVTSVDFGYSHNPDGTRSIYRQERDACERRYLAADGKLAPEAQRFEEVVLQRGADQAAAAARSADYAVVVVGNHVLVNGREAQDRPGLALPPRQRELVRAVAAAAPGRTVVVIVGSYPFAVAEIRDDPNVGAILYTSHAGQAAGTALADVLFGDYAPAGRLSASWLADESSLPTGPSGEVDMLEYDVLAARLTYRYSDAVPVYPFGHGLTYPAFGYERLAAPAVVHAGVPFTVQFDLTNQGTVTSDEVVQVYLHAKDSAYGDNVPRRQLVGFLRVKEIRPGETRPVALPVDPADAFVWDVTSKRRVVESGRYDLLIGASCEDIRLATEISVEGARIGTLDLTEARNAWEHYTVGRGVSHWEVSRRRTLAREGAYHSVVSRRAGDHIGFIQVDLTSVDGIALRVATTTAAWADITAPAVEVRADRPGGPLLGVVGFPPTGGRQEFRTVLADLRGHDGVHDLYLVFGNGGIYLDTVQLLHHRLLHPLPQVGKVPG
jgi:beta-glucosidase